MDALDESSLLLSSIGLSGGEWTLSTSAPREWTNDSFTSCSLLAASTEAPTAAAYFALVRQRVADHLEQGTRRAAIAVLQAGVRCLQGFVQLNLCGPIQNQHVPLWHINSSSTAEASQSGSKQSAQLGQDNLSPDDRWVVCQLEVDGEELVGRITALDWLLAALLCIAEPYGCYTTSSTQQQQVANAAAGAASVDGAQGSSAPQQQQQQQRPHVQWLHGQQLGSWCWWALRAVMLQQHVLLGNSSTLRSVLQQLIQQTVAWAAAMPAADTAAKVAGAAHMECSLVQQHFGQVTDAQQQLEQAAAALGVAVEVTGALGFRTKHQIDPKPQLVAAVKEAVRSAGTTLTAAAVNVPDGVELSELGFESAGLTRELEGMEDASAVYLAPILATAGSTSDAAAAAADGSASSSSTQQQHLPCMLQALLLGYAAQIRKGTSRDELQQWQMAPFVEAVLQQQSTHYMLHATALLLKCRHEKERGRTRERALMQLEQLCNALQGAQPDAAARMPYCYAVRFPLWPLLQKELAELYIGMGFVGAALRIFESLEMWDQLILCYRLLDKKQVAQELVLQRLQVCPDDAKLWCVLGDIQQDPAHYTKAWQVSHHRSSRAQRSLARIALQKKDYAKAARAYELALALNPLYPDAWFALGYCYLKMDDTGKALQAFTKVTHLESDHGEAWTNLAALWLQQGGWKEALHASEQAVKYKRDSWQTWENYATAAAKAGAMHACVRALAQVFELTKGEHLSLETAEQLVQQLEHEHKQLQAAADGSSNTAAQGNDPAAAAGDSKSEDEEIMEAPEQLLHLLAVSNSLPGTNSSSSSTAEHAAAAAAHSAAARQRSFEQVMSALGALLKAVANTAACGAAVWGLLGRWYGLQGQLLSSQEAYLKQVRALQSSPYKSNLAAFAAMASATAHLCSSYLASVTAGQGGLRELSAARMQLRGLLKQCQEVFEEQEQYKQLEQLLREVLAAEDAALAAKKAAEAAAK